MTARKLGNVQLVALAWCRKHNASVRFEIDGTVSIRIGNIRRRASTFLEAWNAIIKATFPGEAP